MKLSKPLGLVLAMCLMLSVLPAPARAADAWDGSALDTSWYNVADPAYTLSDAADLAGLAQLVNGGTDFSGKTITLSAPIDLGDNTWTPIGTVGNPFNGTFSAVQNVVSNLCMITSDSNLGLFGYVGDDGAVTGVRLVDCTIDSPWGTRIGGVAGQVDGAISDCSVSCSSFDHSIEGYGQVGGIAGYVNGGTISDCTSAVLVCGYGTGGSEQIGGIAGYVQGGAINGCTYSAPTVGNGAYAGGIVGQVDGGSIDGCHSSTNVVGTGWAGGIAGATSACVITDCQALGLVESGGSNVGGVVGLAVQSAVSGCGSQCTVRATGISPTGVGGVVGTAGKSGEAAAASTVERCSSTGDVAAPNATGGSSVGGVAGDVIRSVVRDCYATGDVAGYQRVGGVAGAVSELGAVSSCYSTGAATGTEYIGRLIGMGFYATLRNCYYLGSSADTAVGTSSSCTMQYNDYKTADQLALAETAWLLNTTNGTQANSRAWAQAVTPVFADGASHHAVCRLALIDPADPGNPASLYSDTNGAATPPAAPTGLNGKCFLGWYGDSSYATPYVVPATLTDDAAIYANFGVRIISLADYTAAYTGGAIAYAGAVTDNADSISGVGLTYAYYTDSAGKIKTGAANGAASDGAAPAKAGAYYVRAAAAEDTDKKIDSAESNLALFTITNPPPADEPDYYRVSAGQSDGGTVAVSATRVREGRGVSVTITPDEGYRIVDVLVNGISVGPVGHYTISDVSEDISVSARFEKIEDSTAWENPYADVPADAWYYNALAFVSEHGLFSGVDSGSFDPGGAMTRGMAVTVLFRLNGGDAGGSVARFADVPAGSWYESGVAWAGANGIAGGVGGRSFAPDAPITREQLAVMLYNYAKLAGLDVSGTGSSATQGFTDADAVSSWAQSAMAWAVANGIITGDNGRLGPAAAVTRAEVAVIIQRFAEYVGM